MRNLKKLLALVLAMMMALSLMVTANAANPVRDYPDIDQADEAFEEAIDVLTGMKVYSGDNGNFKPASTITRAEVAALIYRLATGDVDDSQAGLYAIYGNFPDVPHDAWYAGYVGYCANAGYIKGRPNGNFDPSGNVTGYEALAMILRAIGYDKNGEFTGATWQTEVSALSQQLGILDNVKTTQYGGTLYLAARRDVVADLLFRADAYVNMVKYTPAFGYQPYGDVNGNNTGNLTGGVANNTLGWKVFGLTSRDDGVVIGNQQTGESNTRLGWSGTQDRTVNGAAITPAISFSAFTWQGKYDVTTTPGTIALPKRDGTAAQNNAANAELGDNDTFKVETGIDLFGHHIKIWYDGKSTSNHTTYAYFDKAKTDVVWAEDTDLTADNVDATDGHTTLREAISGTDLKVASNEKAVFNNSFGKFGELATPALIHDANGDGNYTAGEDQTDDDEVSMAFGNGVALDGATDTDQYVSPVKLYKIIDNDGNGTVDAVIALNIESSQITESNSVNRVPTIGLPVMNWNEKAAEAPADGSFFVEGNQADAVSGTYVSDNLKGVPATTEGVVTGVLAQSALVGSSAKNLGDYEMGIHITGTTRRDVSTNEATAINAQGADKKDLESSYFLLNKVTATVEGTVVAYNRNAGTVTLDNGTVLERSDFYDTVVITNPKTRNGAANSANNAVSATNAPVSAIPQGWVFDAGATDDDIVGQWREGYANTTYKFYTDHEGKYLGAERTFGASFLYGTYLDYDQKVSTSSFNYFLTGVNLNGEIETKQVSKFWAGLDNSSPAHLVFPGNANSPHTIALSGINGTDVLGIPFRDTFGSGQGAVNGIGVGLYYGFTVNGDTVDSIAQDAIYNGTERNEYLVNMARLGVHYAAYLPTPTGGTPGGANVKNPAFNIREIDINNDDIVLGARETINGRDITASGADTDLTSETDPSNKYFTEGTKFILVKGFGTDSVKATVYNGISELKGSAAHVFIKMNGADDTNSISTAIRLASGWGPVAANLMTYYTESPYTYAQSGDTAMKIDTIILPESAVSWSGGSGLYYVGNPSAGMINSWGTDAWKYDLYEDGELKQVWLTNDPSQSTWSVDTNGNDNDYNLFKDTFYNLKDTGKKANDGQPIYTAGNYDVNGVWTGGEGITLNPDPTQLKVPTGANYQWTMTNGNAATGVRYSAVTRDAQTATFTTFTGSADSNQRLLRVADAKVVNLNKGAKASGTSLGDTQKSASGEIWPGITDLATLNEAGSISPVTGRALKVAAVVDPSNPLVVTCIYVCYDQSWS